MRRIWIVGTGTYDKSNIEKFLKLVGLGCKEIRRMYSSCACAEESRPHVIVCVEDESSARECRERFPTAKIIFLLDSWTVGRMKKERVIGPWHKLLVWDNKPTDSEKTRLENAIREYLADIPPYAPQPSLQPPRPTSHRPFSRYD